MCHAVKHNVPRETCHRSCRTFRPIWPLRPRRSFRKWHRLATLRTAPHTIVRRPPQRPHLATRTHRPYYHLQDTLRLLLRRRPLKPHRRPNHPPTPPPSSPAPPTTPHHHPPLTGSAAHCSHSPPAITPRRACACDPPARAAHNPPAMSST